MIRIGLTGNIGSGKSLVSSIFESLGAPVYYADNRAKMILDSEEVHKELLIHFGEKVFFENKVNRQVLASIVFQSKEELAFLNKVIHPRLKEDIKQWFNNQKNTSYAIVEAAILYENAFDDLFDKVLVVSAPQKIRLKRVMERDNAQKQDVINRMQNQWKEKRKIELADYLIVNDGEQMLIPQVLKLSKLF